MTDTSHNNHWSESYGGHDPGSCYVSQQGTGLYHVMHLTSRGAEEGAGYALKADALDALDAHRRES